MVRTESARPLDLPMDREPTASTTVVSPTTGFAVNSNGDLTYNGNTQFYACATGDNGGYNIYTSVTSAQTGCVKIGLNTGGKCSGSNGSGSSSAKQSSAPPASQPASSAPPASKPASSAPPASKPASSAPPASMPPASMPPASMPPAGPTTVYKTTTVYVTSCPANCASMPPASMPPASMPPASAPPASKPPASSAPPASSTGNGNGNGNSGNGNGKGCPTALTGAYQTPHAIIPVNKDQPSTSYGTQYFAYMSSSNSTIFNFDIPSSYAGKQCSVIFLFPKKSDLQTSDFTMSGSGGIKFDQLSSPAPLSVSYASCPAVKSNLGMVDNVTPGNSYMVSTGACQAGTTLSILASSTGGLSLSYFEVSVLTPPNSYSVGN